MGTVREKNNRRDKTTAVWAITPNGIGLGQKLAAALESSILYLPEKERHILKNEPDVNIVLFHKLKSELSAQFSAYASHIFIFSTGISVRLIAPLLAGKVKDPGVVVLDDKGRHAISLISGHLGGANKLTRKVATLVGAVPVITTATDINELPSIDLLAQQQNLYIKNPEAIKYVNMKFLKGLPISVNDPGGYIENCIPESLLAKGNEWNAIDLAVTHKKMKVPRETLVLRPPILSVGIGCNRNTSEADIFDLLVSVFKKHKLSINAIACIATTEVKKDETGILELAERLGCKILFYDKEALNSVHSIQNPSKMAKKHLGVNSVCEAGAILGANMGPLIVTKHKTKDVTVAVAVMK